MLGFRFALKLRCVPKLPIAKYFSDECQTALQAREKLKTIVGSSRSWNEKRHPSVYKAELPSSQAELPPRRMLDSYQEAVIPLGTDNELREPYLNFFNGVRFGRILEDLDTLGALIAYTHTRPQDADDACKSPISIVTALVDKIDMKTTSIASDRDLLMRGHVTWVGNSSVETTMHLDQECEGGVQEILAARFLMVARDPQNKCKAYVNPLDLITDEERMTFNAGEARSRRRKEDAQASLFKVPPNEDERFDIHELFLSTVDASAGTFKHPVKPDNSIWMEDAMLKNVTLCFPQQRNIHNKIFGGFLMRTSFELAWITACTYSKCRPYVIAVDDIIFKQPVEIGAVLFLSSQVVYTCGNNLQLRVHVEKVDPKTRVHTTTNILYFTFSTMSPVPQVVPKSYSEYMMYLEGKRLYAENVPYEHQ